MRGFPSGIYNGSLKLSTSQYNKNPSNVVINADKKQTVTCDHAYFFGEERSTHDSDILLLHSSAKVEAKGIAAKTAITFLNASRFTSKSISSTILVAVKIPLVSLSIQIIKTPKTEMKNFRVI